MYKILFFITIFVFSILAVACGGTEPNANSTKPNANVPVVNNNSVVFNPTPKPVGETLNDAPTLGPVVRAYYEALKKKDDALLKTILSRPFIKEIEEGMRDEKKTGMAAYMAETDQIPEKGIEVRNEKIEGDRGSAELKGGTYVGWSSIPFVKEDGKWKLTNGSTEIESMKPTNMPSNTAK
jgi:hypothetical protein